MSVVRSSSANAPWSYTDLIMHLLTFHPSTGPMVIMVSYQDKDEAEKNRSGNLDMDTIKSEMVAMWQEWGFHMQAMSTLPLGGLRFKPGRMESVLVKEVVRLIEDKLGMM